MELADRSRLKFETFISENSRDEYGLPAIKIFAKSGARMITTILGISGITIGNYIFVKPEIGIRDEESRLRFPSELIAHEIAHVLQYQRQGFFRFFSSYLGSYFRLLRQSKNWSMRSHLEAYSQIPQEIEAREFAAQFKIWCRCQGTERSLPGVKN